MNRLCATCGGPINRGGVASPNNRRCLACRVAAVMNTFTPPMGRLCRCGCGRSAAVDRRGLSNACYLRLYDAGGVALVDRMFPREARRG